MTSVLVVAEDPQIEALLGDLVIFAGYHPVFPRDDERPADSMHRRPVAAVLIDTALPPAVVAACEAAAREHATAVVFVGSTMTAGELRGFADLRGAVCFALPNGPRLLAAALREALSRAGRPAAAEVASPAPQILAALAAVAHARELGTRARVAVEENRELREEVSARLTETRATGDRLRATVLEYTDALRGDGLSHDQALALVTTLIREGAEAMGVPELLGTVEREAASWVDEAYGAA